MFDDRLIIALDVFSINDAIDIINKTKFNTNFYKIGMQLFTSVGIDIIKYLKSENLKIFLDLKLLDIPRTVSATVESASKFGINFITIHSCGNVEMIKAATKVASGTETKIISVTTLTSNENRNDVEDLTKKSLVCGVNGIVCSGEDLRKINKLSGFGSFIKVVPGVRMPENNKNDQKSTITPKEAINLGADYIVVGRPIVHSNIIRVAAEKIIQDMGSGINNDKN